MWEVTEWEQWNIVLTITSQSKNNSSKNHGYMGRKRHFRRLLSRMYFFAPFQASQFLEMPTAVWVFVCEREIEAASFFRAPEANWIIISFFFYFFVCVGKRGISGILDTGVAASWQDSSFSNIWTVSGPIKGKMKVGGRQATNRFPFSHFIFLGDVVWRHHLSKQFSLAASHWGPTATTKHRKPFFPIERPKWKGVSPSSPTHLLKRKRRKDPYWPPSASLSQPDNNNNPTTKKRNFPSADPFKFLFRPHPGTKKLLLFREINISGGESLIILPASACNYSRPKYHPLRPNSRKRVEKMKLVKFATTTPHFPPGSHISGRTWPLFPYNFFSFFSLPEID